MVSVCANELRLPVERLAEFADADVSSRADACPLYAPRAVRLRDVVGALRARVFVPGNFLPMTRDLLPGIGQRHVVILTEVEGHSLGQDRRPVFEWEGLHAVLGEPSDRGQGTNYRPVRCDLSRVALG
jgi:hypothetical protein